MTVTAGGAQDHEQTCDSACQAAQEPALVAFKDSGNGVGLESWDPAASDPCSGGWRGVSCDGAGVVIRLELVGVSSQLTGDLGTLSGLVGLQVLGIQHGITGDLSDVAAMVGLTHLDLGYSAVTGDIDALGGLGGLDFLNLSHCSAVTGDVGELAGCPLHDFLYLRLTAATGWPLRTTSGCMFDDHADNYCCAGGSYADLAEPCAGDCSCLGGGGGGGGH